MADDVTLIEIDDYYFDPDTVIGEWKGASRCLPTALSYAARGWHIFPAPRGEKKSHKSAEHSNGRKWGKTVDPNEIQRDFARWPEANVGIATGSGSGIWVTEADTKKGHAVDGIASLRALEEKHGALPPTLTAESPSGSLHYYFRWPEGREIRNSTSGIAPGIDVRGEGGMVIAPPSVRNDGTYRWLNDLPIAEAPEWLIAAAIAAYGGGDNGNGERKPSAEPEADLELVALAVAVIPNSKRLQLLRGIDITGFSESDDLDWEGWNYICMATYRGTGGRGFAIADAFSQRSKKYNSAATIERWHQLSKSQPNQVGAKTLFWLANKASPGWDNPYHAKVPAVVAAASDPASESVRRMLAELGATEEETKADDAKADDAKADEQQNNAKQETHTGSAGPTGSTEIPSTLAALLYIQNKGPGIPHGPYASRDLLTFAFIADAILCKIGDDVIIAACLDDALDGNAIREHCRDEGERAYVLRQIEQVRAKIHERHSSQQQQQQQANTGWRAAIPLINISNWDNEPVPAQEWAVPDRIPIGKTTLFSGEGGGGKSLIQLQLSAAHALERNWLGVTPRKGAALFIDAEDDEPIIHKRLADILRHYGAKFAEVAKDLHLVSLAGKDAVLGYYHRKSARIQPTTLYAHVLEMAGDLKPTMIGIASSADVFAGNEIDRSQVQQFVALLTRVAMLAKGAVVLISHPSLTGINTDSGLSGSTQWNNSVRARFYLKSMKGASDDAPETNLREIVFKKNNYGPISASVGLEYRNGLFLPVETELDVAVKGERAKNVFLILLARFNSQNRNVSAKNGPSYAPKEFAEEPEAREVRLTKTDLAGAMRLLLKSGEIVQESYGKPSNPHYRLVIPSEESPM